MMWRAEYVSRHPSLLPYTFPFSTVCPLPTAWPPQKGRAELLFFSAITYPSPYLLYPLLYLFSLSPTSKNCLVLLGFSSLLLLTFIEDHFFVR